MNTRKGVAKLVQSHTSAPGGTGGGTTCAVPLTKDQAKAEFRDLVGRYGLHWTARSVPDKAAWERMAAIQAVTSEADRREALGLPVMRRTSGWTPEDGTC